ncbi:MAG: hypothetical protein HY354_05170 [Planctomycetes bacterium]|nr:hypothetical protein [Planctomycetota bacterium]
MNEESKGSDVVIDAESQSYVLVTSPRIYNLIKTKDFGSHELRLYTNSDGLSVYAFTVGSCLAPRSNLMRSWMFQR